VGLFATTLLFSFCDTGGKVSQDGKTQGVGAYPTGAYTQVPAAGAPQGAYTSNPTYVTDYPTPQYAPGVQRV
jgi:hypothetical protein